jgi:hypothetical protein
MLGYVDGSADDSAVQRCQGRHCSVDRRPSSAISAMQQLVRKGAGLRLRLRHAWQTTPRQPRQLRRERHEGRVPTPCRCLRSFLGAKRFEQIALKGISSAGGSDTPARRAGTACGQHHGRHALLRLMQCKGEAQVIYRPSPTTSALPALQGFFSGNLVS